MTAEIARGILPPGALGAGILDDVLPVVEAIVAVATAVAGGDAATIEVNVDLGEGRSVVGTVTGVVGDVLRSASFSRVGARHRLSAWVRLLALTAAHPDRAFSAVTVGRGGDGDAGVARIDTLVAEFAREHLRVLVDLHNRGMCEPLPLYCKTSAAYAAAPPARRVSRASNEWTTDRAGWNREDREPAHLLVLGGVVAFEDLLAAPPLADEDGAGWEPTEPSRFGRYARRLWEPLLASEARSNL